MIRLLSYIGERSAYILILGLVFAILMPSVSSALRPALPFLVSVVLGLAIARLNIREVLVEFKNTRRTLFLLGLVLVLMPITCVMFVSIWRLLGLDSTSELLLVVFAAAPPLSSATSLSLLLGYNARITLQVTLLATLLTPIIGPLCFEIIGVSTDIEFSSMIFRITLMIVGGFLIGLGLQAILGKRVIDRYPEAFNGVVALVMIMFLFPLFDGVLAYIGENPRLSISILVLAIALNLGGNLLCRLITRRFTSTETAAALGLMFGNRNLAIYLAVLPMNPLLGLFIAVSQIPMYSTPALFGKIK